VENLIRLVLAEPQKMSASIGTRVSKLQSIIKNTQASLDLISRRGFGQLIAITETVSSLIQTP